MREKALVIVLILTLAVIGGYFYLIKGKPAYAPSNETSYSGCVTTGCSGQICAQEDVITTCEFRPEYACYQNARCERQPNGQCGWTETPELKSCLARF